MPISSEWDEAPVSERFDQWVLPISIRISLVCKNRQGNHDTGVENADRTCRGITKTYRIVSEVNEDY